MWKLFQNFIFCGKTNFYKIYFSGLSPTAKIMTELDSFLHYKIIVPNVFLLKIHCLFKSMIAFFFNILPFFN